MAAPHTGRTHQIRVHLQQASCPILGDTLYGSAACNQRFGVQRQLLHAWQLELKHPLTGTPLAFCAPPPADFIDLLQRQSLPCPF